MRKRFHLNFEASCGKLRIYDKLPVKMQKIHKNPQITVLKGSSFQKCPRKLGECLLFLLSNPVENLGSLKIFGVFNFVCLQ